MNKTFSRSKVQRLTLLALMTALVIVLQLLVVIKLGAFNISVVMMPIVVGAALLMAGLCFRRDGTAFGRCRAVYVVQRHRYRYHGNRQGYRRRCVRRMDLQIV